MRSYGRRESCPRSPGAPPPARRRIAHSAARGDGRHADAELLGRGRCGQCDCSATSAHLSPERSALERWAAVRPASLPPLTNPFPAALSGSMYVGTADDHEPISGSEKPPPPLSATPRVQ